MNNRYEPPYLYILTIIIATNIILSTYFITILLAGVVFKIFTITIKKKYYYLTSFAVIAFLNIENINGLNFFSLTLISLIIYYLIIPRIKHVLSSDSLMEVIYLIIFYIGYLAINSIIFDIVLLKIITINFIIDNIIIGFFL